MALRFQIVKESLSASFPPLRVCIDRKEIHNRQTYIEIPTSRFRQHSTTGTAPKYQYLQSACVSVSFKNFNLSEPFLKVNMNRLPIEHVSAIAEDLVQSNFLAEPFSCIAETSRDGDVDWLTLTLGSRKHIFNFRLVCYQLRGGSRKTFGKVLGDRKSRVTQGGSARPARHGKSFCIGLIHTDH